MLLFLPYCKLAWNKIMYACRQITELQFGIKVVLDCKPSSLHVKVFTFLLGVTAYVSYVCKHVCLMLPA